MSRRGVLDDKTLRFLGFIVQQSLQRSFFEWCWAVLRTEDHARITAHFVALDHGLAMPGGEVTMGKLFSYGSYKSPHGPEYDREWIILTRRGEAIFELWLHVHELTGVDLSERGAEELVNAVTNYATPKDEHVLRQGGSIVWSPELLFKALAMYRKLTATKTRKNSPKPRRVPRSSRH